MIWEPASLARDAGRESSQKFVEFVAALFGVDVLRARARIIWHFAAALMPNRIITGKPQWFAGRGAATLRGAAALAPKCQLILARTLSARPAWRRSSWLAPSSDTCRTTPDSAPTDPARSLAARCRDSRWDKSRAACRRQGSS